MAGRGDIESDPVVFLGGLRGNSGAAWSAGNAKVGLPLWKELDYFKEYAARLRSFRGDDDAAEAATLSEALYIVSMGTNDFLVNYYAVACGQAAEYSTAAAYGDYLLGVAESFVRELHALGAGRPQGRTQRPPAHGLPPAGARHGERRRVHRRVQRRRRALQSRPPAPWRMSATAPCPRGSTGGGSPAPSASTCSAPAG
ncbi:hypothetical protein OsJ_15675 [Oryza sativa Japonica Group]|uniref:GDSL esterase/lipase n=1 Tax=Oryza sativa subsp. japonica TaxID=39947 RepID=B9FGF5_ORYSJ|nr:hypothetical protein OsJ_15675 [Oryza sativa Japonica Group]